MWQELIIAPNGMKSGRAEKQRAVSPCKRFMFPPPCRSIRGIRVPRRLRTPQGGPGGRGRRRTRSPRTARKSPLTRWECSGGIIPRNFPVCPAYPPNLQNLGGLADAPRPGPDIPPPGGSDRGGKCYNPPRPFSHTRK